MNTTTTYKSIRECCSFTGLPYKYLWGLCRGGQIRTVKSGNKYFINIENLNQFLNEQEEKATK